MSCVSGPGAGTWTGNFQRSVTDYADVMEWPEASLLVVIAYGACYFVNRDVPEQYVAHPSGGVMHPPTFNADRSLLLIADYGDVYAYDRTATLVWRREELSDFEVRFGSSTGNTVAIVTENDTGEHEVTIWLSCTDGRTVR